MTFAPNKKYINVSNDEFLLNASISLTVNEQMNEILTMLISLRANPLLLLRLNKLLAFKAILDLIYLSFIDRERDCRSSIPAKTSRMGH